MRGSICGCSTPVQRISKARSTEDDHRQGEDRAGGGSVIFSGINGRRRIVESRVVEPNAPETYQAFVKELLMPDANSTITLTECYHAYIRHSRGRGQNPPGRKEFRTMISVASWMYSRFGNAMTVQSEREADQWLERNCASTVRFIARDREQLRFDGTVGPYCPERQSIGYIRIPNSFASRPMSS
jgi:hypothetical protein